jgi:hypothetical protein
MKPLGPSVHCHLGNGRHGAHKTKRDQSFAMGMQAGRIGGRGCFSWWLEVIRPLIVALNTQKQRNCKNI